MNVPKNIKRFWMWVGIAMLIELAAITLWKRWYWFFPSHAVSEVYTRYAGTEGLNVTFLKNYRINDSVFVDVTLIEAVDSIAWNLIKEDFRIITPEECNIHSDSTTVSMKFAPHNNYSSPMDTVLLNNDIILTHFTMKTLLVINIENEEQIKAVNRYHINNLQHKIQKK
ncbi:MAG: hypothetical protein J5848_07465 [Bacteroidales bacterium]|nr:hypothetical protein [Bacteroidales bacterium]